MRCPKGLHKLLEDYRVSLLNSLLGYKDFESPLNGSSGSVFSDERTEDFPQKIGVVTTGE